MQIKNENIKNTNEKSKVGIILLKKNNKCEVF